MKNPNSTFHPEYYVLMVVSSGSQRENMDVYQQKADGSDEFICTSHEESAIGQHLIDFLLVSNARLRPLTAEFENQFRFVQSQNFDHHLVPTYLFDILQIYQRIEAIHPWWAAVLSSSSLGGDFNDYSFYSIQPSPYLIETYDEVDRLMDEELYWRSMCNRLQSDLQWLRSYLSLLQSFENALMLCLDAAQPEELNDCTAMKRAFLFQSFFDDRFLRRTEVRRTLNLQEPYSSPLGKTVTREMLLNPETPRIGKIGARNMDFNSVICGKDPPIKLQQLIDMMDGKKVEMTTTLLLQSPEDIYAVCSQYFNLMITTNTKIRKCKNCGKYFVPINRSDEMYCCRVQENGKMCRELDYADKINDDSLLQIYRTAYKTHNARKQRNIKNRTTAEADFKAWVSYAKRLLEQAEAGKISSEEFKSLIGK